LNLFDLLRFELHFTWKTCSYSHVRFIEHQR